MNKFQLTGEVEVEVQREDEPVDLEVVLASEFGLEDGEGFQTDEDGTRTFTAIYKAFRESYAVQVTVHLVEESVHSWSTHITDKKCISAVIKVENLEFEISYNDPFDN